MDVTAQIKQAEARLRNAMLTSDVPALEELLSTNTVFTNQAGVRLTKADDIAAHQSGLLRINQLEPTDEPLIRILGDCVIVCVAIALAGTYYSQPFGGVFAYSRIWHRHADNQWRIEAAHCSPVGQT
jgi:ketosteroid isomerase-like protein